MDLGRRRRRVGGLCGTAAENRTPFILFFLSPDSVLGSHLIPPASSFDGTRGASPSVFAREGCLRYSAYLGLDD